MSKYIWFAIGEIPNGKHEFAVYSHQGEPEELIEKIEADKALYDGYIICGSGDAVKIATEILQDLERFAYKDDIPF